MLIEVLFCTLHSVCNSKTILRIVLVLFYTFAKNVCKVKVTAYMINGTTTFNKNFRL